MKVNCEVLRGVRKDAIAGYKATLINTSGAQVVTGVYAEEDYRLLVEGCEYAKLRGFIVSYSIEHVTEDVKAG